MKLFGYDLIYRPHSDKYIACFGEDYIVHFTQTKGGTWIGKKPFALEPIAMSKTLALCVHNSLRHYEALRVEKRERVARKLADPVVQKAIMHKECTR